MIVPVCLAENPCNTAMAQSVFGMCPAAPFAAGGLYFTSLVGGSTAPVIISFSPTRGDGYTLGWQDAGEGRREKQVAVPFVSLWVRSFVFGGFLGLPRAHGAVWYQFFFQTSIGLSPTILLPSQKFSWLGALWVLILDPREGLILCLSCPPRQGRLQETWIEMGQGPWVHSWSKASIILHQWELY